MLLCRTTSPNNTNININTTNHKCSYHNLDHCPVILGINIIKEMPHIGPMWLPIRISNTINHLQHVIKCNNFNNHLSRQFITNNYHFYKPYQPSLLLPHDQRPTATPFPLNNANISFEPKSASGIIKYVYPDITTKTSPTTTGRAHISNK